MFSRPKILFLVSLLFVALLNSIPTYLLNFFYFYFDINIASCNILQYIAILIAFKVVSIRLLHYKNDWTSCNHKYTVQFLAILYVST